MNWTAVTVIGGALGAWLILRSREARAEPSIPQLAPAQRTSLATTSSPLAPRLKISSVPAKVPTQNDSPSANAQHYLQHIENAALNVDTVEGGASTYEESIAVNEAWLYLSQPIDTLTAQKDLNVLGASPPLVEDGVLGPKTRDAIDSFQRHVDLPPTGVMDAPTSNALRRAVVHVTSQGASPS